MNSALLVSSMHERVGPWVHFLPLTVESQIGIVREEWRELVQAHEHDEGHRVLPGSQCHHIDAASADDAPIGKDSMGPY